MLDKLKLIDEKYNEMEALMASPEVYNDPTAIMKISRSRRKLPRL